MLQQGGEVVNLSSVLVWTQFVVNLQWKLGLIRSALRGLYLMKRQIYLAVQVAERFQPICNLYLLKLILHYHLGHFQAAFAYSEKTEPMLPDLRSQSSYPFAALLPVAGYPATV